MLMSYPLYNVNNYYPPHFRPAEELPLDLALTNLNLHRRVENLPPLNKKQLVGHLSNAELTGSGIGSTLLSLLPSLAPLGLSLV
jgi:hypothetical protein